LADGPSPASYGCALLIGRQQCDDCGGSHLQLAALDHCDQIRDAPARHDDRSLQHPQADAVHPRDLGIRQLVPANWR
jgi:hypothetical protein